MSYNITDITGSTRAMPDIMDNTTENVTLYVCDPQCYAKYVPDAAIFDKYVTLFTYAIGFPGNLFALYIWLQRRMLNSSGYYLAALALADLLFLSLQVFHEINDNWGVRVLDVKFVCEFYPIIFITSQYLSPLLVLGFTVERYISICHPFKRERFCTTKRARIVIVCLAVFSFCLNLIQGYFWSFDSQEGICKPRSSAIEGGDKSLWSIWTWCWETIVFMVVPLLILLFNVLVIHEARRLAKFEKHQLKSHAKSHGNATTVMLLAVSFYQIFTTLPVTIIVTLYVVYTEDSTHSLVNSNMPYLSNNSTLNYIDASALSEKWTSHFNYTLVKTIIEEIGLTHYACNFYIYLITGKIFREEFVSFIQRIFCHGKKKAMLSWNTEYTSVKTTTPGNDSNHMTVRMSNGQTNEHSGNGKLSDDSETPL